MSESSGDAKAPTHRPQTPIRDAATAGATRLAPSPTGALHLGNARTFLVNWAMARRRGWRIVLRIEDLDGPRVKPEASAQAVRLLERLGLDWDEGPIFQSTDRAPYVEAMDRLTRGARAFPSDLTRKEIEAAAAAPHAGDGPGELRFPPGLRPPITSRPFDDRAAASSWRLLVEPGAVAFDDALAGPCSIDVWQSVGDFVIWTKVGTPAYQLAVVVDDHRQGVTEVVRGADLLDSTARQLLLQRALGLASEPRYTHLPLVLGPDGRRLAKRHGDTRLIRYMEGGGAPERVVGLLAWWSGVAPGPTPMGAAEFAERFDLSTMPREPITFRDEDDAWLRGR